jgi:hypothetical protein
LRALLNLFGGLFGLLFFGGLAAAGSGRQYETRNDDSFGHTASGNGYSRS